jgi:anti-anti-sigma factor
MTAEELHIAEVPGSTALTLALAGRVDSRTAPDLQRRVSALLDERPRALIVDMRETAYISSAGLRVLLAAAKRLESGGHRLVLCALSEPVRQVFEMSGFTQLMTIVDSRGEARRLLAE